MLRIATFNVNGIRAASRRGFTEWLAARSCDVVALQEVRAPDEAVPMDVFGGYQFTYSAGNLPGRNGVAILSREKPVAVREGFGHRSFDAEGRYLEVDLSSDLTVGSLYLPKGDLPGTPKHERKMKFLASFGRYLTRARKAAQLAGREFIVMGDFNIAHTALDLKHWRANQQNSGFLPEERNWIASVLGPRRLIDVVRALQPEQPGPYSWWTWRGQAFANDVGWRIDYQLATPALARTATAGGTDRDASAEARISDHAPVVVDYAW